MQARPDVDVAMPTTYDDLFGQVAAMPPVGPQTRDDLRAQVAEQTDLDPDRVGRVAFELQTLREQGLLMGVCVQGTTIFTRRISLEELGIPRSSVRGKTVTPGIKFMAPRDWVRKYDSLAQRLRRALDKYAHDVTGFRPYRYLFYKSYDDFRKDWDKTLAEFMEHRQMALDHYEEWKAQFVQECADRAIEAWYSMMADKPAGVLVIEGKHDRRTFESVEVFTDWIVYRSRLAFPSIERVRNNLVAYYYSAVLTTQADIAAEQAREDQEDAAAAEARARTAEALARTAKADQAQRIAASEAELKMQAIRQAEYDHAIRQLDLVISPVREIMEQLRAQVYQDAVSIAESISKNGFLNPQVGRRIENLIQLFRIRDATGDHDLDGLLDTVLEWTKATPKQTGKAGKVMPTDVAALGKLQDALQNVVSATHDAAMQVALRAERGADLAMIEL